MKNRGITLIALIITIIVMLILVAVVLNLAINGNLLSYAKKASVDTEIAKEKEFIALAYSEANMKAQLNQNTDFRADFEGALIRHSNGRDVEVTSNEYEYIVEFKDVNRFYEVGKDGAVEETLPNDDETPGELAGSGTSSDPYKIQSIEDLVVLSIMVNGGDAELGIEENDFENQYVSLERTLNFKSTLSYCDASTTIYDTYLGGNGQTTLIEQLTNGNGFRGIGAYNKTDLAKPFKGSFWGNNKELKNIYITNKYNPIEGNESVIRVYSKFGLFGYIVDSNIQDLKVYGNAESNNTTGGIVGFAKQSTINDCVSGVNFNKSAYISGGIAGNSSNVNFVNCTYNGTVDLNSLVSSGIIGGIVGSATKSNIIECINSGTMNAKNESYIGRLGGIAGSASSTTKITHCINRADISTNNIEYVAGIAGSCMSQIELTGCINEGNINVENNPLDPNQQGVVSRPVAGIVGMTDNKTNVTSCINKGNIHATNVAYVGGIAGNSEGSNFTDSKFIDVHNEGKIRSDGTMIYVGGIVGRKNYVVIEESSNEGPVSADNSWNSKIYVGGIVGAAEEQGMICSSYNTAPIQAKTEYMSYVGGIVGYTKYGFIGHCYNTGVISGIGKSETDIGGIAGLERAGQIFGCYNKGQISILNDYTSTLNKIGGIAGYCYYTITSKNAYNFGNIVNPPASSSVGGTFGDRIVNGDAQITDFYYETHTWPGTSYDAGVATAVESIDVNQMILDIAAAKETLGQLAFTEEEPNLNNWIIDPNKNDGYPILEWQQE